MSLFRRKPAREECLFKVGDIVKLKTGRSPQEVVEVSERNYGDGYWGWHLTCRYLSSRGGLYEENYRRRRDQHDFELYYQPNEEKETVMTDLYQTKDAEPRFGTKLTENSQGQYVLEMKGEGGKVEAFNPDDLELVVPYTVHLICVPPTDSSMHIQCEPGKLNKGDLLIYEANGRMFRVAAVDTKNRSPRSGSMTFFKLAGELVTVGNDN